MDDEEIVIIPPNPLDETELKLVNIHKKLTESWRNESFSKVGIIQKPLFREDDYNCNHSTFIDENLDLDAELKRIMEHTDPALIPDELICTNNLESVKYQVVNHTNPRQKISAKLRNMELKENDTDHEDRDHEGRKEIEIDRLFNDNEEDIGDYKYSFCEEEEPDHEVECDL